MQLIKTAWEMLRWSRDQRAAGHTIGFVPTMGFLHEGHLSLMRIAGARADKVVASIFVNPTQFAPGEDLERYPRDEQGDLDKCRGVGVDAVFLPPTEEMYPPGAKTLVTVNELGGGLCGGSRPTHFRGVATVVSILFNQVQPDVAVFGQKDFQQLRVIERMTSDLGFPVQIVGGPIVREVDGLAMSSRNAYLTAEQRAQAPALRRALLGAAEAAAGGEATAEGLVEGIRRDITRQPLAEIDYIEIVDAVDLQSCTGTVDRPARAAVAVRFGQTRLIDNLPLGPGAPAP
jgi:pantoate--beta-alanine ligase